MVHVRAMSTVVASVVVSVALIVFAVRLAMASMLIVVSGTDVAPRLVGTFIHLIVSGMLIVFFVPVVLHIASSFLTSISLPASGHDPQPDRARVPSGLAFTR
jgi:hypothetical protein